MKITCPKCGGTGTYGADANRNPRECDECAGTGTETVCISEYALCHTHDRTDDLEAIKRDALRCKADHKTLVAMNPRARDSYDRQLAETLKKLNDEAEKLTKP